MEVQFTPDVQARLDRLAIETGRPRAEFVSDALAGYFEELAKTRKMLDDRYSDLKNGHAGHVSREQVRAHFHEKRAVRRV